MKRVIFDLKTNDGTVTYPDDINLFGATDIETEPGKIIADYHGKLALTPYHPPGSQRPHLVMTGVDSNKTELTRINGALTEATCPLGTTLTFTAKLIGPDGKTLDITDTFRLPIRQSGGRGGMLLADMKGGIVTVSAPFTVAGDDGTWQVDEATINAALPPTLQMVFAGFTVHVFRAAA
ncbi:hypothetical protein GCM10007907_20580 [Chitinimonas prasina]|uniref:Uncharacterized protein n=1 Tax=Chitinimonas prasina TaxID=1434937 RepID=A0ABQ5YHW6_9NEIS|nr:hypothetical protein [Chitinimonas prasina]GLR13268.1 hypothetical protein GCM10007907_20580 [Chitinimonas prasina]